MDISPYLKQHRNHSLNFQCGCVFHLFLFIFGLPDGRRFRDWETYRSLFTSYEIDEEYVKLFEEISKKIKVCISRRSYENLQYANFMFFPGC